MTDVVMIAIAIRLMECWALSIGLEVTGPDSAEVRQYGPHLVVSQMFRLPPALDCGAFLDMDKLDEDLTVFLEKSKLPNVPPLSPYEMGVFDCPSCTCGVTYLRVSVVLM